MEAKLWGEEYNRHRPPKQVLRLTRWRWGWGRPSQGLSSTRVSPGGHRADVRGGDDGPAGETSLPPGALHRGQVHQVQLKLWLRAGRQHPPDPPGEPPRPGPRMCLTLTSSVCPPGLQPLLLRAVGPPADRGGHPGGGGPVHRPADPHGEGHRLRRWEPGYGSAGRGDARTHGAEADGLGLGAFQVCEAWRCSSTPTCATRSARAWA